MQNLAEDTKLAVGRYPNHVAIIMDGNARWAQKNNLSVGEGHHQGAETARKIVEIAVEKNIEYLTLYTFSSENWNRPKDEVEGIIKLLNYYLDEEAKALVKKGCKIRFIGEIEEFGEEIFSKCKNLEEDSKNNSRICIVIALNYGSRQEIISAVQKMQESERNPSLKNVDSLEGFLETSLIPDPDLLIRTGGEKRLSNFLLWQCAYTELYFCDTLWPDFNRDEFDLALEEFEKRERRFGGR